MVSAINLIPQDLIESLDDLLDPMRTLPQTKPVEAPPVADSFRTATRTTKAKQAGKDAIPAVHPHFSQQAPQPAGQAAGQVAALVAAPAVGFATGVLTGATLAIADLLKDRVARLDAPPSAEPEKPIPVRKYGGQLPQFLGQQLYTLKKYQLEGTRGLGIHFALNQDGSRVYFVAERGDDQPLSQAQFRNWILQKAQPEVETARQAEQQLYDDDWRSPSFTQGVIEDWTTTDNVNEQGRSLVQRNFAAESCTTLGKLVEDLNKARDDYKQSGMVLQADQGKALQQLRATVAAEAESKPATGNGSATPSVPVAPASSGQPVPDTTPATGPAPSPVKIDVPVGLSVPDFLQDLLREQDRKDRREREQESEQIRDVIQDENRRAQEGSAEKLAASLRDYRRRIQKEKEAEMGEEMLTVLRISHESRRYEGRFRDLAEKTFLTLINSALVRQPGQEDDLRA